MSRRFSVGWMPIAAVVLALAAASPFCRLALAQEGEDAPLPPKPTEEEDEGGGELPFNMDRLFVPRWRLTDGPHVRAAFRDVIDEAAAATVAVNCDGKRRGLGGVVGSDGWILTKATPLCDKVTVVLHDGRELPGVTVGMDHKYDLALVKIDARGLATLNLTDATVPPVGAWLASVGLERDPVAVGVVSVAPREIPPQPGVLGVVLDQTRANRPIVEQIFENSAADQAGLQPGDRILSVDGVATDSRDALQSRIRSFNPGDRVTLKFKRGDKTITAQATLGGTFPGIEGRSEFQNNLGGKLSVRRFGFPVALQHDSVLRPDDCGGPVVDLDGRVIGFNIARAGRTESYTIPTGAIRNVVAELMETGLAAMLKLEKSGGASESRPTSTTPAPSTPPPPEVPAKDAAAEYADEGYELVWSDEFNTDGAPDDEKWGYERGFVRNEELQWYQPENVRCDGGLLVIEARDEHVDNPRYRPFSAEWDEYRAGADYTSASIRTRGKASWQYGRFEMRAQIDVRPGLWPAFWTLGNEGGWPAGGEIDVMEYYRNTLLANAAWADVGNRAKWDDSRTSLADLGEGWADSFHVWRMDWDEDRIALSVDGRILNEVDLDDTINETDGENPFRAPHFLILNLAIGGTNGGDPRNTDFPARFEVDYVRVYKKPNPGR